MADFEEGEVEIEDSDEEFLTRESPTRCPEGTHKGWIKEIKWGEWKEKTDKQTGEWTKNVRSLIITILPQENYYPVTWFSQDILEQDGIGKIVLCRYPSVRGTFFLPVKAFCDDLEGARLVIFNGGYLSKLKELGIAGILSGEPCQALLGLPLSFTVVHKKGTGRMGIEQTYANVVGVGPWVEGEPLLSIVEEEEEEDVPF